MQRWYLMLLIIATMLLGCCDQSEQFPTGGTHILDRGQVRYALDNWAYASHPKAHGITDARITACGQRLWPDCEHFRVSQSFVSPSVENRLIAWIELSDRIDGPRPRYCAIRLEDSWAQDMPMNRESLIKVPPHSHLDTAATRLVAAAFLAILTDPELDPNEIAVVCTDVDFLRTAKALADHRSLWKTQLGRQYGYNERIWYPGYSYQTRSAYDSVALDYEIDYPTVLFEADQQTVTLIAFLTWTSPKAEGIWGGPGLVTFHVSFRNGEFEGLEYEVIRCWQTRLGLKPWLDSLGVGED